MQISVTHKAVQAALNKLFHVEVHCRRINTQVDAVCASIEVLLVQLEQRGTTKSHDPQAMLAALNEVRSRSARDALAYFQQYLEDPEARSVQEAIARLRSEVSYLKEPAQKVAFEVSKFARYLLSQVDAWEEQTLFGGDALITISDEGYLPMHTMTVGGTSEGLSASMEACIQTLGFLKLFVFNEVQQLS